MATQLKLTLAEWKSMGLYAQYYGMRQMLPSYEFTTDRAFIFSCLAPVWVTDKWTCIGQTSMPRAHEKALAVVATLRLLSR